MNRRTWFAKLMAVAGAALVAVKIRPNTLRGWYSVRISDSNLDMMPNCITLGEWRKLKGLPDLERDGFVLPGEPVPFS